MRNGVMRYTLDHVTNRTVQGKYGFIVQVSAVQYIFIVPQNNRKRFTHRRTPFEMTSLIEPFSEERFNFNKISPKEVAISAIKYTIYFFLDII